ncbi:hypothetical protein FIV42_08180 [Persicimonas caeni]|uniref:Uncharacterized protein n=1 Tax=Persicimonas caeni TaxID=2292766 RepID=A0A4Y6PQW4_PERCE|nr:hypothetical protein [Persicimonas caeni]QDG50706.1 hypothetical protein FIV42_08180 [Persicimonas caeni]QED31927.1 hypothetical protein FRD00_08175 [Persicimonas caeni]
MRRLEKFSAEVSSPVYGKEEERYADHAEGDARAATWMRLVNKSPDIPDAYARFLLITLSMFLEGDVVPVTFDDVLEEPHLKN